MKDMKEIKVCLMCDNIYETETTKNEEINVCPKCKNELCEEKTTDKINEITKVFDKIVSKNKIKNEHLIVAMSFFLLGLSTQEKNNWAGLTNKEEELFFKIGLDKLKDNCPVEFEKLDKLITETAADFDKK